MKRSKTYTVTVCNTKNGHIWDDHFDTKAERIRYVETLKTLKNNPCIVIGLGEIIE